MRFALSPNLVRTTPFRLTAALGVGFELAVLVLLGLIYAQTAGFLSRRVDLILTAEAGALSRTTPSEILRVIKEQSNRDPLAEFSLYSQSGERVAGAGSRNPLDIPVDGVPHDVSRRGAPHRALAARLPWGEVLVVQRDTSQLEDLRRTIVNALIWSGALITLLGILLAVGLSLAPLRRVQATHTASEAIAAGDLRVRLPIDGSRDEIDELARIVNTMMDEVERLITQARTVGESVAHELRTPLTRLRATLDHAADRLEKDDPRRALLDTCVAEADSVLARFAGLLRIAAVEARGRRGGIAKMSLTDAVNQSAELYEPLAADLQITLKASVAPNISITADAELMFELISNLIDNALKFTPTGGEVTVTLQPSLGGPQIVVADDGPGIDVEDLPLVTQRFYRSRKASAVPGHGLGLSLVLAVAQLHGFSLKLEHGHPGLVVRLTCTPPSGLADDERVAA